MIEPENEKKLTWNSLVFVLASKGIVSPLMKYVKWVMIHSLFGTLGPCEKCTKKVSCWFEVKKTKPKKV